jgi:hypothetical protein
MRLLKKYPCIDSSSPLQGRRVLSRTHDTDKEIGGLPSLLLINWRKTCVWDDFAPMLSGLPYMEGCLFWKVWDWF